MVVDMPKHIASGLKYLAAVKLKEQGESQQAIANELGIDRSTVYHYLNSICNDREFEAVVADSCIGCGLCVSMCSMKAIKLESLKAHVDSIQCCGCQLCKDECPTNSIKILEI